MSRSNCCLLTCMQVSQEAGQVVWYAHLFQNFPQFIVIHTVKGFGIVNKAEIDVFLELSCFFDDPADVGNLISGSSAFSKTSLDSWRFMVHILLKPGLENFEPYFTRVWDKCNCAVVWAFFLWDWNENWPFPVLWPLLSRISSTYCSATASKLLKFCRFRDKLCPNRQGLSRNPCGKNVQVNWKAGCIGSSKANRNWLSSTKGTKWKASLKSITEKCLAHSGISDNRV